MRIPKPETRKARIEIIPMIDAIFFLLVFFMFSSLSMIKLQGADVALPAARASGKGAATGQTKGNTLVLSVTAGNEFFLNKSKVARDQLASALQNAVNGQPNAVVVVNMAKTQTAQTLIDVMEALNSVKGRGDQAPSVLIATEPVEASTGRVSAGSAPKSSTTDKAQSGKAAR
jgi:biopolymer transport protein ExbD